MPLKQSYSALFLCLLLNVSVEAGLSPYQSAILSESLRNAAQETPEGELTVTHSETPLGTEVILTTSFTNNTQGNADVVDIVNPIPDRSIYLPNSATGANCEITFSVDGGISWDKPENLFIYKEDGSRELAKPSDYTHIRWLHSAVLAPRASSQVSFMVRYP